MRVRVCLSRKFCHLTLSDASSQLTLGYSVCDGPIGESVRVAPRQMYSRQHAAFDQNQVIIWPCGWEYFWKEKKWLKSLGTRGRNVYEAKMDEIKNGMRDRNVYEAMQKCDFTTAFGGRNVDKGSCHWIFLRLWRGTMVFPWYGVSITWWRCLK